MPDTLAFPVPPAPPPNRGRLLDARALAALIGGVSAAWVRRNVPGKVVLGHSTVRWYEGDVQAWLERCRAGEPAR